jgi:hypothetical protein
MTTKRVQFSQFYIIPALFIVGLITLILCIYFFVQYQRTKVLLSNPSEMVKQEGDEMMRVITPVVHIAQNESPIIATVADKTKLAGQPFFENAENGDKVLMFRTSNTVVLYRPSIKKIISVSSIPKEQQVELSAPTQKEGVPVRVIVLNGSRINGVAKKTADTITQSIKNITIVKEETTEKKTYTKTQVIYVTAQAQSIATQIAQLLDGEVSNTIPEGEKDFDADIMVIATE